MRHFPHVPSTLLLTVLLAGIHAGRAGAGTAERAGEPRVVIAGAARDTLPYAWQEILPVAIVELERNDWTLQRTDSASTGASPNASPGASHRLVTRWKPIKHVLARVFLGSVQARAVVDLDPLEGRSTVVTIQGGLASREDIEGNPGFAAAQSAYRRAAQRWLDRVKSTLEAREPAGPVSHR
jgi:hypothetical protein